MGYSDIFNSNEELVEHLINSGVLYSNSIIEAFINIDRANFVLDPLASNVYGDYPLQIGHGQTISQPTTVAIMLEMLDAKKYHKVLDVGSGSGWSSALLGFIVSDKGSVTGLERVPELVKLGNNHLNKYSFKNVKIIQAKEELGIPGEMFDRILVSASAKEFPYELTKQLKVGGKLVIPVGNSIYEITKKDEDILEKVEHYGFVFVPLIY